MILAALLIQAATPPTTRASAAPPPRFSILADPCPARRSDEEVVVCGADGAPSPRLPDPASVVPDRPLPSNPYLTGAGALAAGRPCAARMEGCQVGFGPPIGPMIAAGVKGVKNALQDRREAAARRRDGARRVPIALDDGPAGHLEP